MVKEFITEIEKQRKEIDAKHEADMKYHGYREAITDPVKEETVVKAHNTRDTQTRHKPKTDFTIKNISEILNQWKILRSSDRVIFLMALGIPKKSAYKYTKDFTDIVNSV